MHKGKKERSGDERRAQKKRDDFTDFFMNKSQFQFYGCGWEKVS
jgi:hypothetical protein